MPKRRFHILATYAIALACCSLVMLAACGSGSGSHSSKTLDTDENRALLAESGLVKDFSSSDRESIITSPWIAIEKVQDEDAGEIWRIVGSSEEKLDSDTLAGMRFVAVVDWGKISATYESSGGGTSTGSSEYADIVYYDAASGVSCGSEHIKGKELPDTARSTPQYTIDDWDVVDVIDARVASGLGPSYSPDKFTVEDGVLTGININALNEQSVISIPEGVTEISADAISDLAKYHKLKRLRLPESLTAIDGEITIDDQGDFSYQDPVLAVYDGSFAWQYAENGGYVYGVRGTLDAYVPDGTTEIGKVSYSYSNLGAFEYLHIPASVTAIRDGALSHDSIIVVQPNSYAAKAVEQFELSWCLEGHQDEIFVPDGYDWIPTISEDALANISKIHLPASAIQISDQMDGYLQKYKDGLTLYVKAGSFAESYAKDNGIAYKTE